MENNTKSKKGLGIGIGVVALAVVILLTYASQNSTTKNTAIAPSVPVTPSNPPTTKPITPTTPVVDTKKSMNQDGTYTAVGSYMSPGGPDKIGVTLTLASDIVTDVSLNLQAGDRTSQRYQDMFASAYKTSVVGQSISTLNLQRISRSSLTPEGFNDAITQIRAQAKA